MVTRSDNSNTHPGDFYLLREENPLVLDRDQKVSAVAQGALLNHLSYETLSNCFSFLGLKDLVQLSHTNKGMREIVLNYLGELWIKAKEMAEAEDGCFPCKQMVKRVEGRKIDILEGFQTICDKNKSVVSFVGTLERLILYFQVQKKLAKISHPSTCGLVSKLYEDSALYGIPEAALAWELVKIKYWMKAKQDRFTKTTELDLRCRAIQTVPPEIIYFKKLKKLSLKFNKIKDLHQHGFNSLGWLKNLERLEELDISFNQLERLAPGAFNPLAALTIKKLDLSKNQLTSLPSVFHSLKSLEELHVDCNQVDSLSPDVFASLSSLKVLNMKSNQLKSLPPGVFDELVNLRELDISYNQLKSLPPDVFRKLKLLEVLALHFNEFNSLSPDVISSVRMLDRLSKFNNRCLNELPSRVLASIKGGRVDAVEDDEYFDAVEDFDHVDAVENNRNNLDNFSLETFYAALPLLLTIVILQSLLNISG